MADQRSAAKQVAVALAVVRDTTGRLLIGRRADQLHQGGLLEFPGGKIESGESSAEAMVRELQEETGLTAQVYRPLITVPHLYPAGADQPALQVTLHVYLVSLWLNGESSAVAPGWSWVDLNCLQLADFPAANKSIFHALKLPESMMITDHLQGSVKARLAVINSAIARGARLVCLRDPDLSNAAYQQVAAELLGVLKEQNCQVMVNCDPSLAVVADADGLHLNSKRLAAAQCRPVADDRWLSASCHSQLELVQAQALGVDFVTLSPVLPTRSHPGAATLGWPTFSELVGQTNLPTYALGGLGWHDLALARQMGGQGIAGISLFR